MSDDLISRKAVIEAIARHTREDGVLDNDISVILEDIETAFNKEKVMDELQNAAYLYIGNGLWHVELRDALEIIEKGGIK